MFHKVTQIPNFIVHIVPADKTGELKLSSMLVVKDLTYGFFSQAARALESPSTMLPIYMLFFRRPWTCRDSVSR